VNTETVTRWMKACAASIAEQRDYLTQLDAAIGDADHGANMTRGFNAVEAKLDGLDSGTRPGHALMQAGSTLVSTVGGASGPLWGSGLRRAGKALGDADTFAPADLVAALDAALAGIVELGAAEPGDKTIVDALGPAVAALRAGVEGGRPLASAAAEARAAAEEGMRATIPMQARKGRASYLGERSVGHQDPGATSTALIMAALERTVAEES
jgi:phosphoenolpyruvate---glycerone phosphotransferase subunit DhaL